MGGAGGTEWGRSAGLPFLGPGLAPPRRLPKWDAVGGHKARKTIEPAIKYAARRRTLERATVPKSYALVKGQSVFSLSGQHATSNLVGVRSGPVFGRCFLRTPRSPPDTLPCSLASPSRNDCSNEGRSGRFDLQATKERNRFPAQKSAALPRPQRGAVKDACFRAPQGDFPDDKPSNSQVETQRSAAPSREKETEAFPPANLQGRPSIFAIK